MNRVVLFSAVSLASLSSAASAGAPSAPAPAKAAAAAPAAAAPAAPTAPPPAAMLASPIERRLFSDSIEASSFLWNDWNRFQENYHPNYIADDDPSTAWVEGSATSGAGEWVRIAVTPLEQTSKVRLRLRNGYQKSAALFKANARAKDVVVRLAPSGKEQKVTLADKQGWQDVAVEQAPAALRSVELRVTSVYEGSKYEDLVISDVQIFATSLTRDNPSFEKSKRQNLLDWRKARIAAAKLFKAGRGEALPLYSSYRATSRPLSGDAEQVASMGLDDLLKAAALEPSFAEWRDAVKLAQAISADPTTLVPAQISPVDTTPLPEVDGFQEMQLEDAFEGNVQEGVLRLPMLGYASAFSTEKLRVLDQKGKTPGEYRESVYTDRCRPAAWVKRVKATEANAPDRVAALLIAKCGEVPSREGTTMASVQQLMVFGKDGRLILVAGDGYVDGYRWGANGKISGGLSVQPSTMVVLQDSQFAAPK
jgi:hypothetical protein